MNEEEDSYTTELKQRWGFLTSWWEALKPCIAYAFPETARTEEHVWIAADIVLEVTMPNRRGSSRDETTFRKQFQEVQEALALLVAVEHADPRAYVHILTRCCGLVMGRFGEELKTVNIETRFLPDVDVAKSENQTDDGATVYDIVRFCGTHQREHPSEEYLAALSQIAALNEKLKPGEPGADITIPVKLQFSSDMKGIPAWASRDDASMFSDITRAEKEIETQWTTYNEEEEKALEPGTLRCTFVLEPMAADFNGLGSRTEFGTSMSPWIACAIGDLLRNNASLHVVTRNAEHAHICYYLERPSTTQDRAFSQLKVLKLTCEATMPAWDFEAMCSALVATRSTRKLALELDIDTEDPTNRNHWWKWLAYALFSKRARACSSLRTLILPELGRLTVADVHAFASVLASEHSEETLCGTPRGAIEERDATLTPGSPIRWEFDQVGQPVVHSRLLTLDMSIESVRTFSDDGTSEWCRRCNLEFNGESRTNSSQLGITSLTLEFPESDIATTVMVAPFIKVIGPSLTMLTLSEPQKKRARDFDENVVIQSCPNLLELTLVRDLIEVQLDFREYRATKTPVPQLTFSWFSVPKLVGYLSDPENPLTRCTRRLKVSLQKCIVPVADLESGRAPNFRYYVDAVVEMLEKNDRLEYLSVESPYIRYVSDFKNFHLKPIRRQLEPLPKKCMLAFLSVLESRTSTDSTERMEAQTSEAMVGDIDQHVVAKSFSFAALPVLREVYFESNQGLSCLWMKVDNYSCKGDTDISSRQSPLSNLNQIIMMNKY
ncbi:hypothetical protein PHYSODRAFT_306235 [Phytophthora sojae]|uniref:Uncharacterized protein n=1 Tax=Phytophthora sojae (strain P6497) TaxID=1094619 RepID=G5A8J6_PHYSP|nr:hypothetical protein PHYSODRAFT_306235 [Phytophthora sojae]EGZ08222.1 hypothetical protein PHYSODRAFT_306235 [Phytophthora sojae]|eukprot:XP_009536394.1 hypothetical protein PHYSODRAFT_306235 [Phytophthora sojae]